MDCAICYDAITAATGKVELSCSHVYHFSCLTSWFSSQSGNSIQQSCPCCRHESNEHEKMFTKVDTVDPDDDDYQSDGNSVSQQMTEQERINLAAAKERAAFLFLRLKNYNSKEDVESYAASRIAALARGSWARQIARNLRAWKEEKSFMCDLILLNKARLRKSEMMSHRYMQASMMPLRDWKNLQASIIQKWILKKTKATK